MLKYCWQNMSVSLRSEVKWSSTIRLKVKNTIFGRICVGEYLEYVPHKTCQKQCFLSFIRIVFACLMSTIRRTKCIPKYYSSTLLAGSQQYYRVGPTTCTCYDDIFLCNTQSIWTKQMFKNVKETEKNPFILRNVDLTKLNSTLRIQ